MTTVAILALFRFLGDIRVVVVSLFLIFTIDPSLDFL